MKRKSYDTVTEAMRDLKDLGYTIDFSILIDGECLVCHQTSTRLAPDDFEIDDFYRFEGDSDPGDEMIVYAISSKKKNVKGVVVQAYGLYADAATSSIVEKLNTHPQKKSMNIIDKIIQYFKNENDLKEDSSPEGTCALCWGKQEYDGKIRKLLKDKQIDINNHKDSYMMIQDFVIHNIDGVKLGEGVINDCPDCSAMNEK
jgi:hypothetical protein